MTFQAAVFPEPELLFGDGQRHIDPRQGLRDHGPLQAHAGEVVTVGVIGTDATCDGFTRFLADAQMGVAPDKTSLPNLNPDFPGLGNANPFACRFLVPDEGRRTLARRRLRDVTTAPSTAVAIDRLIDIVLGEIDVLREGAAKPDVVVFAMSVDLIEAVHHGWTASAEPGDDGGAAVPDFRDMLKARAMERGVVTQIVWPDIYDDTARIPQKVKRERDRTIQARATRTWNLLAKLFYKSGKVPWKLDERPEYATNFLGIGFHRSLDGQQLWTSTAQMFDEAGRGLVMRGARAQTERRGRRPYLSRADMRILVTGSLEAYKRFHRTLPARLVVLKTSRFRSEEADGIEDALDTLGVEMRDMVWVQESTPIALHRNGKFPVLRGTFVDLGGKGLLYTRGSVPFYGTYPGQRVPRPLLLSPHEQTDRSVRQLAEEVFALTKVNWTSTQMDQKLPAPIRASRKVGEILKHVPEGAPVQADYRFYI